MREELDRCAPASARPSRRRQADIVRLLLATGCRKNEIVRLQWREVDGAVLDLADGKTGPRKVLLNAQALAIVERQPRTESPYVFPSAFGASDQPRPPALVRSEEAGRDRGCPLARSAAYVRQPCGDAGRSTAGGGAPARPPERADDASVCACRGQGRGGRGRTSRSGPSSCTERRSRRTLRRPGRPAGSRSGRRTDGAGCERRKLSVAPRRS